MSTGKYYLVDSGYANTNCFIVPYKSTRYHLSNYREPSQRTYKRKGKFITTNMHNDKILWNALLEYLRRNFAFLLR
ncbi:hypothetical protein AXF42_Ash018588 [Apostasia shenzhenica]|uniref:DDE Tnp4 domain-containing protein n=1 Tax=Apostasia shenzhenica TaxID=1088818 RepID=A0A2I0APX6_9ASPA|nr:hypothetical protein AXF42_Ash018588 [Apostasia shenzhenica]